MPDAGLAGSFRNYRDQAVVERKRRGLHRHVRIQANALDCPYRGQIHAGDMARCVVLSVPKTKRRRIQASRRERLRQAQGVRQLGTGHIAPGRFSEQRMPGSDHDLNLSRNFRIATCRPPVNNANAPRGLKG
jgi:hypothetical protein